MMLSVVHHWCCVCSEYVPPNCAQKMNESMKEYFRYFWHFFQSRHATVFVTCYMCSLAECRLNQGGFLVLHFCVVCFFWVAVSF